MLVQPVIFGRPRGGQWVCSLRHRRPCEAVRRTRCSWDLARAGKLEFPPDYWRESAAEVRRLAELIDDNFTAETLLEIALQYDELAVHAERRSSQR